MRVTSQAHSHRHIAVAALKSVLLCAGLMPAEGKVAAFLEERVNAGVNFILSAELDHARRDYKCAQPDAFTTFLSSACYLPNHYFAFSCCSGSEWGCRLASEQVNLECESILQDGLL